MLYNDEICYILRPINDKEEQTYTYEIFNLYRENKNLTIEQMKGDNKIQKQFLEEIKNKRIDNEINKSELAKILGIARCTIYKYLKENDSTLIKGKLDDNMKINIEYIENTKKIL